MWLNSDSIILIRVVLLLWLSAHASACPSRPGVGNMRKFCLSSPANQCCTTNAHTQSLPATSAGTSVSQSPQAAMIVRNMRTFCLNNPAHHTCTAIAHTQSFMATSGLSGSTFSAAIQSTQPQSTANMPGTESQSPTQPPSTEVLPTNTQLSTQATILATRPTGLWSSMQPTDSGVQPTGSQPSMQQTESATQPAGSQLSMQTTILAAQLTGSQLSMQQTMPTSQPTTILHETIPVTSSMPGTTGTSTPGVSHFRAGGSATVQSPMPTLTVTTIPGVTEVSSTRKIVIREFQLNDTAAMTGMMDNFTKELLPPSPDDSSNGLSPALLESLNQLGQSILDKMPPAAEEIASVAVKSGDIVLEVAKVKRENFTGYSFPGSAGGVVDTDMKIALPKDVFANSVGDEATIITLSVKSDKQTRDNATSEFVNSGLLSARVDPPLSNNTKEPIVLVFAHNKPRASSNQESLCSYWKYSNRTTGSGNWSQDGCKVADSNATHTVCHCYHLTEFSVLFRTNERQISKGHALALSFLTTIGCVISVVCLMMLIMVLCCLRILNSDRNVIHVNLAIALLCANIIFLSMDHAKKYREACLGVSIMLFYFFMASFCWMLVEGIYIWMMVVKVFAQSSSLGVYFLIGWGFPAAIVGGVAGYARWNMINDSFCWLPRTDHLIWAFVGPVMLVILINFIILMRTLLSSVRSTKGTTIVSNLRTSARLTLILLPVLGFTWAVGIFMINEYSLTVEYIFTILNSLQGLFVFIFYVLLNAEVRKEFRRSSEKRRLTSMMKPSSTESTTPSRKTSYQVSAAPHELKRISPSYY